VNSTTQFLFAWTVTSPALAALGCTIDWALTSRTWHSIVRSWQKPNLSRWSLGGRWDLRAWARRLGRLRGRHLCQGRGRQQRLNVAAAAAEIKAATAAGKEATSAAKAWSLGQPKWRPRWWLKKMVAGLRNPNPLCYHVNHLRFKDDGTLTLG
jgi:hypothetical protein